MKIVNVIGGLGNQLFQYAFAIALQAEFPNEEIKINTHCFRGYPLHNGYELDRIFDINIPQASISELFKYAYPWGHYRLWQVGHKVLPLRNSMIWDTNIIGDFDFRQVAEKNYFDGYWQSDKFFIKHKDAVRKAFRFPELQGSLNQEAFDFINQESTAFIHVRRGDYINHPLYKGICTLDYYSQAIERLREKRQYNQFLIFSNDIQWCKDNLSKLFIGTTIIYVDWNKGNDCYRDIQLMSKCDAGIVANSSFSWWGAWLSEAKEILCPSKWINDPSLNKDIIPSSWVKI